MKKVYIVLESGQIFCGKSFGAEHEVIGEIVFTTGMTGYIETLTDPSYYGQIVLQTFPLIGNYGIISPDFESKKPVVSAYVVRENCKEPSNFRCESDLDSYLKKNNIVGVSDVDTRELTKIIREKGVMNACITTEENIDAAKKKLSSYTIVSAVESVTCKSAEMEKCNNEKFNVVLWDFGAKENIKRELMKRGCSVTKVPSTYTAEQIKALNADGIMLSNGPGDPAENVALIAELKKLVGSVPIFGICLGHQLLALAHGGKTAKLKYGHRGTNQPAKDLSTGRVYITSQNHGYAVLSEMLPKNIAKESFINVNDGTCEGVDYLNSPTFSVQFHPEACGGPRDTVFLFDKFIKLMEERKNAAQ